MKFRPLFFLSLTLVCFPVLASVRFAYLESAESGVNGPLVSETIKELAKLFGGDFSAQRLTENELRQAISHNEIDLFLSSSAFYCRRTQ